MIERLDIRLAVPADARAIARVHVESWRSAYAGLVPDRVLIDMNVDAKATYWRGVLKRVTPQSLILVADSGQPIGFCYAGPAGGPDRERSGEIYMLYVDPDQQGRGLGRALLGACLRRLEQQGFRSAWVWVLANNPARFFYQAMGGRKAGERQESLWGAVLPELAYRWTDLDRLPAVLAPK